MATAVNIAHSSLARVGNGGFCAALEEVSGLPPDLDGIVAEFLFPKPQGWIAEWTGPHGYDVVHKAVLRAYFHVTAGRYDLGERSGPYRRWRLGCERNVDIIVQYLQKSDIFALSDAEICEGALKEKTPLTHGPISLILGYLRSAESEKPMPLEIDDEMQEDLSNHFSVEMLAPFPHIRKFTELSSLYWCPAGMTAMLGQRIGLKYGLGLFDLQLWAKSVPFCHLATQGNSWLQCPNAVFLRGRSREAMQASMPVGFRFPRVPEITFFAFVRYACTKQELLPRGTFTVCEEVGPVGERVMVGDSDCNGLGVIYTQSYGVSDGVAPIRVTALF